MERLRPLRSGWPQGLLSVLWQVRDSMGLPPGHYSSQEVGEEARTLVYFIGLGCLARVWVWGLDLQLMVYLPGPGSDPMKTPCQARGGG